MNLSTKGIEDAAKRESEFHPTRGSFTITAWTRRAGELRTAFSEIENLRRELDELKAELRNRPF